MIRLKLIPFPIVLFLFIYSLAAQDDSTYSLVWSDEFETEGTPDDKKWSFEKGFRRNKEAQWYQPENAFCKDGFLIIEARRENKGNPNFTNKGDDDWRKNRDSIYITSSSLHTKGKASWTYGRFELRAKIPVALGFWPAFWTLGVEGDWPENGEIDVMEYYRGLLLANVAWGSKKKGVPEWRISEKYLHTFNEEDWASKFHIWRMDWDEKYIRLFVDDMLLNQVSLEETINRNGKAVNPFTKPHYMLINLAVGGMQGGDPTYSGFPAQYLIDYVRVYQKKKP